MTDGGIPLARPRLSCNGPVLFENLNCHVSIFCSGPHQLVDQFRDQMFQFRGTFQGLNFAAVAMDGRSFDAHLGHSQLASALHVARACRVPLGETGWRALCSARVERAICPRAHASTCEPTLGALLSSLSLNVFGGQANLVPALQKWPLLQDRNTH